MAMPGFDEIFYGRSCLPLIWWSLRALTLSGWTVERWDFPIRSWTIYWCRKQNSGCLQVLPLVQAARVFSASILPVPGLSYSRG